MAVQLQSYPSTPNQPKRFMSSVKAGQLQSIWIVDRLQLINNLPMRKFLFLLFALLTLTQAISDKDILQQALNGLFQENKLPDPTTVVPCIDDDTAHKLVVFVGEVLEKAAKGSVTDLIQLKDLIQKFGDQIPQPVKDCLDGNAEFAAVGAKYGLPAADSAALEKKIIAYVTLHYLTVHGWFGTLNNEWKAGKYYQTGFDGAGYGHKLLGMSISEFVKMRNIE